MQKWVKTLFRAFLGTLKKVLLASIVKMDDLEPRLAEVIRANVDPDKTAKKIVDMIQRHLTDSVEKVL